MQRPQEMVEQSHKQQCTKARETICSDITLNNPCKKTACDEEHTEQEHDKTRRTRLARNEQINIMNRLVKIGIRPAELTHQRRNKLTDAQAKKRMGFYDTSGPTIIIHAMSDCLFGGGDAGAISR